MATSTSAAGDHGPRLLAVAALVGAAAGVVASLLTLALRAVQWAAVGPSAAGEPEGFAGISWVRRLLVPTSGALVVGAAWWVLRARARVVGVRASLASGERMPVIATALDALTQIIGVGAGLSVGREGAPRQAAAALADRLARHLRFSARDRAALVAAAAGGGLAAVYNVPLAGVAFACEVLGVNAFWPAVIASAVGTVVAWPVVGMRPTYVFPTAAFPWQGWIFAFVVAPAGWIVGRAFARLAGVARARAPHPGPRQLLAIVGAGLLVGALSCWVPELPGNGKGLVQISFAGAGSVLLLLAMTLVKPLLTSATLGAGVAGGLLTPALATGATLGGACALVLHQPAAAPAFALAGAVSVLAGSELSPVFAGLLGIELTHAPLPYAGAIVIVSALGLALKRVSTHSRARLA